MTYIVFSGTLNPTQSINQSVPKDISGTTCAVFTKFFVHVACVRGSVLLGMLMIGHVACQREGDDGSAQCGRSVIYDCHFVQYPPFHGTE